MTGLIFAALHGTALSQGDEARRDAEERQRLEQLRARQEELNEQRVRESREQFVNEARENAQIALDHSARGASTDRDFLINVPAFRKAVSNYREAVSARNSTERPLKDIDKLIVTFKAYFKATHVEGLTPDRAEFKGLSKKELVGETLASSERIGTELQQASVLIQAASRSNSMSIQTMLFLRSLHSELLRLEILRGKLK